MKKSYLTAVVALLAGSLTAQTVGKECTISANATLKDGSTVKGEFATQSINGSTSFMEKLLRQTIATLKRSNL